MQDAVEHRSLPWVPLGRAFLVYNLGDSPEDRDSDPSAGTRTLSTSGIRRHKTARARQAEGL